MSVLILSVCCLSSDIASQNTSNRFFSSGSEIVVDVLPGNDIFYSHPYDKGINIYSLAEIFQVNAEKLFAFNKLSPSQPIKDGKIVKIPFSSKILDINPTSKSNGQPYLSVWYIVKKGESLYRISKEYFDTDIIRIKILNNKKNESVQTGEKLLIGWLPLPVEKSKKKNEKQGDVLKTPVKTPVIKMQDKNEKNTVTSAPEADDEHIPIVKYYLSDVIGIWDRSAASSKSYFVLHDEARPGSMMDVYYPMLKKHIKAKVLGKIPASTYNEEVSLIISPMAAKDLGILDFRFKVNIKYEK